MLSYKLCPLVQWCVLLAELLPGPWKFTAQSWCGVLAEKWLPVWGLFSQHLCVQWGPWSEFWLVNCGSKWCTLFHEIKIALTTLYFFSLLICWRDVDPRIALRLDKIKDLWKPGAPCLCGAQTGATWGPFHLCSSGTFSNVSIAPSRCECQCSLKLAQCCSAWDLQSPRLSEHHLNNSNACRHIRQKETSSEILVMEGATWVCTEPNRRGNGFPACCGHRVSGPASMGGGDNQLCLPLALRVKLPHSWDHGQSTSPALNEIPWLEIHGPIIIWRNGWIWEAK